MTIVLKAENITKRFPGVLAVDNVSMELRKGEVLALVGENGAGKSTLMQILGGALKPDSGRLVIDGKEVIFNSPQDAIRAGVSMVFQELSLVKSLSVAENLFANRQPIGRFNNIKWRELYQETECFLRRFNLSIDPRCLVKHLPMGQQQILEILKAISANPKILLLDEPTSSLTESEILYLFENIRRLQESGMSIIYITHKLSEIFQIANRVMVMRDGRYIGDRSIKEVTENDLVCMMVGRQIVNLYGSTTCQFDGDEYFKVENLTRRGMFYNITFGLKPGEILGIAGLVGAKRTEVAQAIIGVLPKDTGRIILRGKNLRINRPRDAIRERIAYLTEDRKELGLFLGMSVRENLVAPSLRKYVSFLDILDRSRIDDFSRQVVQRLAISTPSLAKKMMYLSGGNQQKCLVGMWMGIEPEVIIFDEPTRGVDVGARAEIYQKLREFADAGVGIILISSDLTELIGMCDRILVMHAGRIQGEVNRKDFSEELILAYAAGLAGN
jgi:ABC-type sugar transport system ATPase subunit